MSSNSLPDMLANNFIGFDSGSKLGAEPLRDIRIPVLKGEQVVVMVDPLTISGTMKDSRRLKTDLSPCIRFMSPMASLSILSLAMRTSFRTARDFFATLSTMAYTHNKQLISDDEALRTSLISFRTWTKRHEHSNRDN